MSDRESGAEADAPSEEPAEPEEHAEHAERVEPLNEASPPPTFVSSSAEDALWAKVDADWDDADAHKRFIGHCHAHGELASAAARYRGFIDERGPDHDEHDRAVGARKRLGAIAALAIADLEMKAAARRESLESGRPKKLKAAAVAFLFVVAAILWVIVTR